MDEGIWVAECPGSLRTEPEEERHRCPGVKMGSVRRNQFWSMENGRDQKESGTVGYSGGRMRTEVQLHLGQKGSLGK